MVGEGWVDSSVVKLFACTVAHTSTFAPVRDIGRLVSLCLCALVFVNNSPVDRRLEAPFSSFTRPRNPTYCITPACLQYLPMCPCLLQVHVRMWGQFFTDILWGGVLSALRAAPLDLLSGSAGVNAGVPSLLEAFLNLVAVQVRGRHGSRVLFFVRSFNYLQLLYVPVNNRCEK